MQKDTLTHTIHSNEWIQKKLTIQFLLSKVELRAIAESRCTIENIIHGRDQRLLGSIHDNDAIRDYARYLHILSTELSAQLYIVMIKRFFDLEAELQITCDLLLELIRVRLLLATTLNRNNIQYLGNWFNWLAISAQPIEAKTHCEEVASSFSMPVVVKNNTNANLATVINVMNIVMIFYRFMDVNQAGQVYLLQTHSGPILLYEEMRYSVSVSMIHQLDGNL